MSIPWATMAHKSGCADAIVRPGSLEHLGRGLRWAPSYQAQATICHGRPRIGFLAIQVLVPFAVTASLLLFLVIAAGLTRSSSGRGSHGRPIEIPRPIEMSTEPASLSNVSRWPDDGDLAFLSSPSARSSRSSRRPGP